MSTNQTWTRDLLTQVAVTMAESPTAPRSPARDVYAWLLVVIGQDATLPTPTGANLRTIVTLANQLCETRGQPPFTLGSNSIPFEELGKWRAGVQRFRETQATLLAPLPPETHSAFAAALSHLVQVANRQARDGAEAALWTQSEAHAHACGELLDLLAAQEAEIAAALAAVERERAAHAASRTAAETATGRLSVEIARLTDLLEGARRESASILARAHSAEGFVESLRQALAAGGQREDRLAHQVAELQARLADSAIRTETTPTRRSSGSARKAARQGAPLRTPQPRARSTTR